MLLSKFYGFFDDNYTLRNKGYNGEDRMSPKQFIVMGILLVLIILISVLLRKTKKEKLYTIYKVLAIFMPIFEIIKIAYSTYFDLTNGAPFNWGGILPLYSCSMLLYFLPFVAWGKGKMHDYSVAFFSTIGMVAGLSNFIYLSSAGFYPIFTYGAMYSIIFHGVIVFVGMSLIICGEYKPTFRSIIDGMVPILMFSCIVIPINFIIRYNTNDTWVDYMMLMNCNGFPVFGDFSNYLASHGLLLLFSFFMLGIMYPLATTLMVLIEMGIIKLVDYIKEKTTKNESEVEVE